MAHTAKSLFGKNIQSAEACIKLYDGIEKIGPSLDITWLLRSSMVFSVGALDAYFHDKIKYRAGRFVNCMPKALKEFKVPLAGLAIWDNAERKGNVLRNWLTDHFSVRPLQEKDHIAQALNLVGIDKLWATVEGDTSRRNELLATLKRFVGRRNKIVHEGDRKAGRSSGKKLRPMKRSDAQECIDYVKALVRRIEEKFPS